jgi:hypothetical protein
MDENQNMHHTDNVLDAHRHFYFPQPFCKVGIILQIRKLRDRKVK